MTDNQKPSDLESWLYLKNSELAQNGASYQYGKCEVTVEVIGMLKNSMKYRTH